MEIGQQSNKLLLPSLTNRPQIINNENKNQNGLNIGPRPPSIDPAKTPFARTKYRNGGRRKQRKTRKQRRRKSRKN